MASIDEVHVFGKKPTLDNLSVLCMILKEICKYTKFVQQTKIFVFFVVRAFRKAS